MKELIAVTSLSPNHANKENQLKAIASWQELGFKVYSINCAAEIANLKEYPVHFIETKQTGEAKFGKPFVKLTAFRDFVKENGSAMLINSDILIGGGIRRAIEMSSKGLLLLNRWDYEETTTRSSIFKDGFDAFYLTPEIAAILPETELALGQCHWDYWLPLCAMKNRIPLFSVDFPIIFHKKHGIQWSVASWYRTNEIFAAELSLQGPIREVSRNAYHAIYSQISYLKP